MSEIQECKTTCPYCGVGCGIIAKFNSDGLISVAGDPDHPANKGKLCSKGSALAETMSEDGRLTTPIISGKPSDWDTALELITDQMRNAIDRFGPDSVAFYVSGQLLTEDYYVANKLMKGFVGSANIDTNSRLCMASSVAGHKRAFGSDTVPVSYEDLENADLVILVGSNLAWCHPVLYQRLAAEKERRPNLKIVLIDPRRTMTSDIVDLHLAIDPDGDVALFMGLFQHLANSTAYNPEFVRSHTNGFQAALEQSANLTPETVSFLTGLKIQEIEDFFRLFNDTSKVVTVYSQGVNQSKSGTDKVNAIINCHLITGRIGRPGAGPFSITGQPNAMGGREVGGLANMLAAHMDIDNPQHRDLVQSFWQSPAIADKAGLKAVDLFQAVDRGDIKFLWIIATNPVDSLPQSNFIKSALKKCPFVVVSDIYANTDTNKFAHVLLPSAGWGEKDGTVTNSERRISRQRGFLSPPGEAKADWWQLAEVGKRLGFQEAFSYTSPADIYKEHAALSGAENDGTRDFDISAHATISKIEYDTMAPFRWPLPNKKTESDVPFFSDGTFFTQDGKARIIPVETPCGETKPVQFILNTGRIRDQWHTMTRTGRSSRLSAHLAEPFTEIHPLNAGRLGLQDGDILETRNHEGRTLTRALITDRQKRGHVFTPMHWTDEFASCARVNSLIPSVTDPVSGQPASKNAVVEIQKYKAKTYLFILSRQKPVLPEGIYWATTQTDGGWRTEMASEEELVLSPAKLQKLLQIETPIEPLIYEDKIRQELRVAWFDEGRLEAVAYSAPSPVTVSRSWLCAKFADTPMDPASRLRLVAGKAPLNEKDKGAIICSCFSVGSNEISEAISQGCCSVKAIGELTQAGTNCGSCRSEIASQLQRSQLIAAE